MKKNRRFKVDDPFAEREALKYDNPIPSREYILTFLDKRGSPASFDTVATALKIKDDERLLALKRRLRAMEREGQLLFSRREEYCVASKMDMVRGIVITQRNGDAFVLPQDGKAHILLAQRQVRDLLHGDKVLVRLTGSLKSGQREGVIVEILERATVTVVGRYQLQSGIGLVTLFNKRFGREVIIPPQQNNNAKPGDIVKAEITAFPNRIQEAVGKITAVLGATEFLGKEIDLSIQTHNLPNAWPEAVINAAEKYKEKISRTEVKKRVDLRELPLVTIDGEDARDFDDAVFCEPIARGGFRLVVAIADVSHYVKEHSALDKEAYNRGNSVYFPNRVIPMLPEVLSNGLCSLNPNVERLCMVCDMRVNKTGKVTHYEFYEAVMNSHARLTYTEVAKLLANEPNLIDVEYPELVPYLKQLHDLYRVLSKARKIRGAIDFDSNETRILFNKVGAIEKIVPVYRNDAHKLIEECMLLANVCAARFLEKANIRALYRIHDIPQPDKLNDLREFLLEFNLHLGGGVTPEASDFSTVLDSVKKRPEKHLINTVMLRSLSQAMYSPKNSGHFGLAYKAYTHFTSPIRRYPDLLIHRALKKVIGAAEFDKSHDWGEPFNNESLMMALGEHSSMTERRADDATRDAIMWMKCQYLSEHIGSVFNGTISSVTHFGCFVELDELYVDGLVHITGLGKDYYHFDPIRHRLVGQATKQTFRLGDRIRIRVDRVDVESRKIDFGLPSVDENEPVRKRERSKSKDKKSRDDKKSTKARSATKPSKRKIKDKKEGKPKVRKPKKRAL